ncbi:hypothetical protein OHU34_11940 [Streptomyces sp. NBC_00080]|uniref:hypothetical protein n=1 Tax=Streptomyces TaxID=1883 RepID=UPI00116C84BF|nr:MULTISPECIES: hypothetical protein [Streptomyces]TQJ56116.1 hypothetical protein FBY34_3932 [Streptomyces sp. SLBN-115]
MIPADMGGGPTDVRRGYMALSTFKKRVDDLLTAFEKSAGGSAKVGGHSLSEATFGAGQFPEAKDLHLQYERVHERITTLSKSLGLQLEAMQIAVHGVDVTFDNLEEDLRYRFHEIRTEVNRDREEALNKQTERTNDADHTDAGY